METSLRQIREYGEAVIEIDQEPSKLSDSIKANTHTKITFNLGNSKDLLDAAGNLGLDEPELFNLLTVGHALISVKERIPAPVHVAFPKVHIR